MTLKNPTQGQPCYLQGLFFSIFLFCGQHMLAQVNSIDSSQKVLLASVEKKTASYLVKNANVQYPEILKGNEEQMSDYIEKFCARRKEYLVRMYNKGKELLPKAAAILKEHDLPEELKVLLTLESAYNGNAVSRAGAVGYWQFMDAVAKEYGLKYATRIKKITRKKVIRIKGKKVVIEKLVYKKKIKLKDDRKNFNKATVAAARYLRDRRANLADNWLLVVASYNCGVGNVWSAMERSGKDDPTFWDIKDYLPQETQAYVMNFITLNVIFANYDNFLKDNLIFKPVKIELPDNTEQYMSGSPVETDAVELR